MLSLLNILDNYVFSGIPSNAAYELLKLVWQRLTEKSWEELYLESFEKAVQEERYMLSHYASKDGKISINRQDLLRILKQDLGSLPQFSTYSKLIDDKYLTRLASALEEHSILIIGGHNLSPDGYAHLVNNIVRHAQKIFRASVVSNQNRFNQMLQQTAEELLDSADDARKTLQELSDYLDDRFDLVLSKLNLLVSMVNNVQNQLQQVVQQNHDKRKISADEAHPLKDKKDWVGSPFPGLRAFRSYEASIFFGRVRETEELIRRVKTNRFVAVVGASGSGKSSLVSAGLVPNLQEKFLILGFTPGQYGDNPFFTLATMIIPHLNADEWTPRSLAAYILANPPSLVNICEQILKIYHDKAEILFIIDQFEEIFTIENSNVRNGVFELLTIISNSKRIRNVITLRSDFYHKFIEWPKLAELLKLGHFPLTRPRLGSVFDMITRPAILAGLEFEDGLVQRILDDLGTDPGILPLLAFALEELYNAREAGNKLTHHTYDAFGGVQGALGNRAEETFLMLPSSVRVTLPEVFRSIVEVDERGVVMRQRAQTNQFSRNAMHFIDSFTSARLFVQSGEHDKSPVVEVAHEALLRSWPRIVTWIEDTQDDLRLLRQVRIAAEEWEFQQRNPSFLWPAERLKPIYEMIDRLNSLLDKTISDFIQPEQDRLMEEINNYVTTHQRRSAIGERLSVICDKRSGVGLKPDNMPDILWLKISPKRKLGKICINDFLFDIQTFFISRYLITFAQFQSFIENNGYHKDMYWEDLAKREIEPMQQTIKFNNHPRDNVSWYEAVAFCRWLTSKFLQTNYTMQNLKGSWTVRLPTEWEWQLAANANDKLNVYPWGSNWDSSLANTRESGLFRSTAVGVYPGGDSPFGVSDMSGNVQEWCLNKYEDPTNIQVSGTDRRVIRGGSWNHFNSFAKTTFRFFNFPYDRSSYIGFRIVLVKNQPRQKS